MSALIEVVGVSKAFGHGTARVQALADIDLAVTGGEVVGLRGPSGSGKSTLLNLIACILEPDSGVLRLVGETVWDGGWRRKDLRALRRERIGFIFQAHNLLPFLDATDNVALALTLNGTPLPEARQQARALLDRLGVGRRLRAMPAMLSGGEAQRVSIARALANRPRVILADEPTAALDSQRAQVVMELLRQLAREQDAAVLVVTHDEKIFSRFDRLISLRDGRVEGVWTAPGAAPAAVPSPPA